MQNIEYLKGKVKGRLKEDFLLSSVNWFNTGGKAEILFEPKDKEDLITFLKALDTNVNITIIGAGSNLLISDHGVKGVVIKLGNGFKTTEQLDDTTVKAGAGIKNMLFSENMTKLGLSNFEFLSGIPGTIGGSMYMNAGAYGTEIKDILTEAELVDRYGNIYNMQNQDIGYIYRGNNLKKDMFFISGIFKGIISPVDKIRKNVKEIKEHRIKTQPVNSRTGGSTFKNPSPDIKAWELIKQAGCHNMQYGGAKISEKHSNFIINTGNATTTDIITLGNQIIKAVKQKTGILLKWEIKKIGE